MARNALLRRLGIEHPILLSPMAGAGGTPELAAAVSNAGGVGAWGGAYAKPEDIVATIRQMRSLTARPFNINLFAGGYGADHKIDPRPMLQLVGEAHAALGLPPPVLPPVPRDPFDEQLQVVLEERPPVFSFTFGLPSAAQMTALRQRDIFVIGTATTVEEAVSLEQAGVDAIAVQGAEAGAHRGTFAARFEDAIGAAREAAARDLRENKIAGDRLRRIDGRLRHRGGPQARRSGGPTRHGVFALSGIRRTSGAQTGAAARPEGHDCHHPRLFRPAGPRPDQPLHRHGEQQNDE